MDNRERSILKTLLYADIFNYPLKENEIFKFLISEKKFSKEEIHKILKGIRQISYKNNYYFLKGKSHLVSNRVEKQKISNYKFKKAKKIANIISFFPTVNFIGISGALAMKNSEENDDIDFFVISEKNFAWTTRAVLVLSLIILGVYRRRNITKYKDNICLNMIIDGENISFNKKFQNLYTAHEIIQIVPLVDKKNTYKKFIKENLWYKSFLPNAEYSNSLYLQKTQGILGNLLIVLLNIFQIERTLRYLQKKYMEKYITKEILKNGFIAFHPFDYKSYTLQNYNKKIKEYSL